MSFPFYPTVTENYHNFQISKNSTIPENLSRKNRCAMCPLRQWEALAMRPQSSPTPGRKEKTERTKTTEE